MADGYQSSIHEFGRAAEIDKVLGLNNINSFQIASIILYSGNIEFYLERAIWRLDGTDPSGMQPRTDAKPIVALIKMFERHACLCSTANESSLITTWCEAARSGFTIRNNIVHGVTMNIHDTLVLMRNPQWEGETRKRAFGDLWCDEHTMNLVKQAFAVLLRTIIRISTSDTELVDVAKPDTLRVLCDARSILGELASQYYNPSFEKY